MDALVTDASSRMSYSALRSLSDLGLKVAVADTKKTGMGQWSKFAKARYIYSHPLARPEDFINDLNKILHETGAKFLLPGSDETEIVAKYRDRLPREVVVPIAEYESIKLANDKMRMFQFAEKFGIPVPTILKWKDLDELRSAMETTGQVVIKLRKGSASKGVYYPKNPDDGVNICKKLMEEFSFPPDRYPIVQKKINGHQWTVSSVHYGGREIAFFTQHMLREKPRTGGTSTYRISSRNSEIEEYSRKLLNAMDYQGIANIEFKYDEDTGKFWFIEINPRLWGAISHSVAAGTDFVKLLYLASTKGCDAARWASKPYKLGIYSQWLAGDWMIAATELKRFRLLKALRLLLPYKTDDYDELKADDLGAMAGEMAYYFKRMVRAGRLNSPAEKGYFG